MSLSKPTTPPFIPEAKVTACWPSAQILEYPCLFCMSVLPKGQCFISREFQTPNFCQAFCGYTAHAKPKLFFTSFSPKSHEAPWLQHQPSSFSKKYSISPAQIAFFLGIKSASQTCSPFTRSLSNTFCNNSHMVTVGTTLPAKSLELPVSKKNAEDLCEKSFGIFQAGFFFFFLAELLGISFKN